MGVKDSSEVELPTLLEAVKIKVQNINQYDMYLLISIMVRKDNSEDALPA